jgi:hypothetical protein
MRQKIASADGNGGGAMDGVEHIRDLLQQEEIELAAWAAGHESWAVVLWRAKQSLPDLLPEVYGPYLPGRPPGEERPAAAPPPTSRALVL